MCTSKVREVVKVNRNKIHRLQESLIKITIRGKEVITHRAVLLEEMEQEWQESLKMFHCLLFWLHRNHMERFPIMSIQSNEGLLNQILLLKLIKKIGKLFLSKELKKIWSYMELQELKMTSQQSKKE